MTSKYPYKRGDVIGDLTFVRFLDKHERPHGKSGHFAELQCKCGGLHITTIPNLRRKLEFSLTNDEFKVLVTSSCHYCGLEPSRIVKGRYDSCKANGVDRVDNDQGYVLTNCVPCCKACNRAKDVRGEQEFLEWARRIARKNPPKFVVTAA